MTARNFHYCIFHFGQMSPLDTLITSFNPLTPGAHGQVIHTEPNLQLSAASLFKYVRPFSGHQALKG